MREVVYIFEREGARGDPYWRLVLDCGHSVARRRHDPRSFSVIAMFRPLSAMLAPRRVQCHYCRSGCERQAMTKGRHPPCIPQRVAPPSEDPHAGCKATINDLLSKLARTNVQCKSDAARIAELEHQLASLMCWGRVPYMDGELDEERANAFCAHLSTCENCQRDIKQNAELDAKISDLASSGAPPFPRRFRR